MRYILDPTQRPMYLSLYKMMRDDIINGVYPYNSKLPSQRTLADQSGVSTITIEHTYALLCDEGYVESRKRSGYFVIFKKSDVFYEAATSVKAKPNKPFAREDCRGISASVLAKTMRRVITDYYDVLLVKSANSGHTVLREAIKNHLARNRGIVVDTEQIVIGSGAEYLYGLIILLLGKDKKYAFETPSYEVIEKIYSTAGVEYELLPLADDGIETGALFSSSADVLHTTPYQSYPSGVTASASKRYEYIRWSDMADRFIIESDYGSEFAVSAKPMESLFALADRDNVIYLNTFSKTVSSSIRVGYMVLPKRLTQPFREKLGFYSCTVPTFEQYVLAELLNNGDFERHINRVRRKKRKEMVN